MEVPLCPQWVSLACTEVACFKSEQLLENCAALSTWLFLFLLLDSLFATCCPSSLSVLLGHDSVYYDSYSHSCAVVSLT